MALLGCGAGGGGSTGTEPATGSSGDTGVTGGVVTGSTGATGGPGSSTGDGPGTSGGPGPTGGPGSSDDTGASGGTSSGTSGDASGDPSGDPTGPVCDAEMHAGKATYYDADGSGNCSFPAAPGDPLVAAMNDADYAQSAACGACVAIDGPDGSVTVRIVDRCPGCPQGDIDLHPDAFAAIADPQLGVVPIAWRYVPCPVDGNIIYHFKEGTNPFYAAVQIRDHRNAIATFEYKDARSGWKPVARVDYNYFVEASGMGPGPYSFRVTDVDGNVLEDDGVPFVEAGDSPGSGQFPACTP